MKATDPFHYCLIQTNSSAADTVVYISSTSKAGRNYLFQAISEDFVKIFLLTKEKKDFVTSVH